MENRTSAAAFKIVLGQRCARELERRLMKPLAHEQYDVRGRCSSFGDGRHCGLCRDRTQLAAGGFDHVPVRHFLGLDFNKRLRLDHNIDDQHRSRREYPKRHHDYYYGKHQSDYILDHDYHDHHDNFCDTDDHDDDQFYDEHDFDHSHHFHHDDHHNDLHDPHHIHDIDDIKHHHDDDNAIVHDYDHDVYDYDVHIHLLHDYAVSASSGLGNDNNPRPQGLCYLLGSMFRDNLHQPDRVVQHELHRPRGVDVRDLV